MLKSKLEYEAIKERNEIFRAQLSSARECYTNIINAYNNTTGGNDLLVSGSFQNLYSYSHDVSSCFTESKEKKTQGEKKALFVNIVEQYRALSGETRPIVTEIRRFLDGNICFAEDADIFYGGIFPKVDKKDLESLSRNELAIFVFVRFIELFAIGKPEVE